MIDISSRSTGPASILSNFSSHEFVIDDIQCNSMEGFLQSLKFSSADEQKKVCLLVGFKAKSKGKPKKWQDSQLLFWKGVAIQRESMEYQTLLRRAFVAMFAQVPIAKQALLATGTELLRHTMGKNDPKQTVLTENEFCSILTEIRSTYQII